ncbi:MAG: peptidase T [Acidobacteriota bacterium]|jgi:tripeptide aminopeptidase
MSPDHDLPPVAARFLRYVQIDTQSNPDSDSIPTTEKQKDLSRLLAEELREMGVEDAEMDEHGYVYATVPAAGPAADRPAESAPTLALVAHVDTSPDEPGGPVKPRVHRSYDGSVVELGGDPPVRLDPERSPGLLDHLGHDLITGDGTTLLGSDDKAGVAVIMQLAEDLVNDPSLPRPRLRLCFTVDEEVGRGIDALDLDRLGADAAYTLDGGPVGELDTETFNAATATVRVQGVNVHPGKARGVMANAVRILAEILAALPADQSPEATDGTEGYFFPHRIADGASPVAAEAQILLRDFEADGLARRKRFVEHLVEAARAAHPRATIELEIEDSYRNMKSYIAETDPRTIELAFAAAEAMGLELTEQRIRGGTDGARLSEEGLPTPNIFTGGHDFHSRFEWNTVQNLETTLAYVKRLMAHWAEQGD